MSELINTNISGGRHRLLAGTSLLALLVAVACPGESQAQAEERPSVWIELGGQFEHLSEGQDKFAPPFLLGASPLGPFPFGVPRPAGFVPIDVPSVPFDRSQPLDAQKPPSTDFGGEAKIRFAPHGTDWVFAAAVRYGHANGGKRLIQSTSDRPQYDANLSNPTNPNPRTPGVVRFSDADTDYSQSHTVVDFQVGRDVGLGLFGGQSAINVGIRFAQFASKSTTTINEVPQFQAYSYTQNFGTFGHFHKYQTRFQSYAFSAHSQRSFHGIGPSLSWDGSLPVAGNPDATELAFDWGINAAVLFGRQKVKVDHETNGYEHLIRPAFAPTRLGRYNHDTPENVRSRSVTVPNLGAFAGLSARYANAKISFGYRADFFFGAMDAGIDTRHSEDMSFHGPFAKISIGLGG